VSMISCMGCIESGKCWMQNNNVKGCWKWNGGGYLVVENEIEL
jgi:hypothetical protein